MKCIMTTQLNAEHIHEITVKVFIKYMALCGIAQNLAFYERNSAWATI